MRTFEYRLYPNKAQRALLMGCLIESRHIYNEMLEATKHQYAQTGKFLFKYDLTMRFVGRGGDRVPATTVQMLADRLDKALRRYLAFKEQGLPCGFPRFKTPNRWHSMQLRQHKKDFRLHEDGKHLCVPGKVGLLLKIKLHRPLEGTPQICHLVLRADGHWYALIVCEPAETEANHPFDESTPCTHSDVGLDVGLKVFL